MTDSDANLSIDFLAGFTIFMVAFIWVATLVPNLFIGVSSHGVDFDSVAYRTGVILAEDPGVTNLNTTRWEFQPDSGKDNIERFGLAISKQTPNILSEIKVKRFFDSDDTGVFSPDDYREKVIFGDYPYRFNISLLEEGQPPRFVGEERPKIFGYMRREVKIKHSSNATIDKTDVVKFLLNNSDTNGPSLIRDGNVTFHDFVIEINRTRLLAGNITNPIINPNYNDAYRIDPRSEEINITIEGFHEKPPIGKWVPGFSTINLSCVTLSQRTYETDPVPVELPHQLWKDYLYHNMNLATPVEAPFELLQDDNLTLIFKPGFFPAAYDRGSIYVTLRFEVATANPDPTGGAFKGHQYLNTSKSGPWEYTYNATEVTQPVLTNGVMEVAVW
jgi:hypothetical protein